jgi:hypothetical protein
MVKTKKKNQCAPFIQPIDLDPNTLTKKNLNLIKSATNHTCFTIDSLRKIADKWSTTYPKNPIKYTSRTTGKQLWDKINKKMNQQCKSEICWLKQTFIKDTPLANELFDNFKPIMPKKWSQNKYEWLNTLEIRNVMKQYETKHKDFEFIGPVPIDFDTQFGFGQCVVNELCKINLYKLVNKGKSKIGVIFNLDKHYQTGSHWVAMYLDYNDGHINYWDSYAAEPAKEITTLMSRLKNQASNNNKKLTIRINNTRHQYKNSECGVYCLYFITSLLNGKNFHDVTKNIIDDDTMNSMRSNFFTKNM